MPSDRPALREEILADLEDIAMRDPKWALAKAFEYGYAAGRHAGTTATLDRLFPVQPTKGETPC